MSDMMFGSVSPMWTAMPLAGPAYQPMGIGNRPIAAPLFGAPAQQNQFGSGFAPYPFALNPSGALIGADAAGVITASSLLAAVAMRRGQPQGPTNDNEVEEFLYDALELLPGSADVEVRCDGGRATLTGSVQHKRTKRDIGEIAWALPGLQDVQNNVSITSRRRGRAGREAEPPASASARKQG